MTDPAPSARPRTRGLLMVGGVVVAVAILVAGGLWVRARLAPQAGASAPETTSVSSVAASAPATSVAPTRSSPVTSTAPVPIPSPPSPSSTTVPAPPVAAEPTQRFLGSGHTATFRYFSVTVLDEAPAAPVDGRAGLKVRVCVRELPPGYTGSVRISRDPWRLVSDKEISLSPATSGLYQPAFPVEVSKGVGQCQEGFLTFVIPPDYVNDSSNLVYANGVGETASWNFH